MERKRVGIVVFEEIEVLDFCGPFEVFAATRLNEARRRQEPSPFEVWLVAENRAPVVTAGGMQVIPHHSFASCPRLDILVVPGGWGTRREISNPAMLAWLSLRAPEVEILTSVCTGAMLLGAAGLLDGRRATTHWRSLDWLRDSFPAVTVVHDEHVVEDGHVLTSAGIAAGIDLALKVVARCCGETVARATARHMEYPYPDKNTRRI
jgi:transcriptional regulator GlxA family with amidase domain